MNNYKENKEELILYALIIGIFLFVLTAFNKHDYSNCQNSIDNTFIITEFSEVASSAILTTPAVFPDFNESWITSDNSCLKHKPNNKFSVFSTNRKINTEYDLCTETYLNIKPLTFIVSASFVYSPNEYAEYPSIS